MTLLAYSSVENIIKEYLEHKDRSIQFGKKRMDAEKEYNKLLTKYNGESKNYSLAAGRQHLQSVYGYGQFRAGISKSGKNIPGGGT